MEKPEASPSTTEPRSASDGVRVMMVIPQFPPPVIGGMERQAEELAKALAVLGVGVLVLTGRTRAGQPHSRVAEGVRVLRTAFPGPKWIRFPVSGTAIARAMLRHRREYDVVHVHTLSWFGALAVMLARLLGKPVLVKPPTGLERAFRRPSFRFFLFQRCDAIALLAPDAVRACVQLGFPMSRIFRITNGVSMDRFGAPSETRGSQGDELGVVFVGRLIPEKGLLDLLDVWPRVLDRCQRPVRLAICGDGPQAGELQRKVEELGLEDSIAFMGHVSNIRDELVRADVFVLPSLIEGNSNAILEAMAAGLPILSTAVGGTPMLVGPEGEPWLVEARDRRHLEEHLARLLSEPETRAALGDAMRARAQDVMAIESVAERYRAAYLRLAAGQRDRVGSESSRAFGPVTRDDTIAGSRALGGR
jgi:glycosyltransferase involved in cell wall biosynthesis